MQLLTFVFEIVCVFLWLDAGTLDLALYWALGLLGLGLFDFALQLLLDCVEHFWLYMNI
jgi:hypothetical protein